MFRTSVLCAIIIGIASSLCISCRADSALEASDAGIRQIDANTGPRSDRFRMATWNLGCFRDDADPVFCNTEESGETYIRTQSHIDELKAHGQEFDADMVFVQEVENAAALRLIFPGWQVQTLGSGAQQVGVAVSPNSSATLLNVEELQELQVSPGLRPGLVATIEFDQEQLQILSVHLKTGCNASSLDSGAPACDTLMAQLGVIESWIMARRARGEMFMLTGDFNRRMEGGEEFFLALQAAAGGGLHRTTAGRETTCWHHHPSAPHFTNYIDHHIVSENVVTRWGVPSFELHNFSALYPNAWKFLSDHCPVTAEL